VADRPVTAWDLRVGQWIVVQVGSRFEGESTPLHKSTVKRLAAVEADVRDLVLTFDDGKKLNVDAADRLFLRDP